MIVPAIAEGLYAARQNKSPFLAVIRTSEGITLRLYQREKALELNEDLSVRERLPGWFALGDNDEDGLLCVHARSGKLALIPIEPLSASEAMELPGSVDSLLNESDIQAAGA